MATSVLVNQTLVYMFFFFNINILATEYISIEAFVLEIDNLGNEKVHILGLNTGIFLKV